MLLSVTRGILCNLDIFWAPDFKYLVWIAPKGDVFELCVTLQLPNWHYLGFFLHYSAHDQHNLTAKNEKLTVPDGIRYLNTICLWYKWSLKKGLEHLLLPYRSFLCFVLRPNRSSPFYIGIKAAIVTSFHYGNVLVETFAMLIAFRTEVGRKNVDVTVQKCILNIILHPKCWYAFTMLSTSLT